MLEKNRPMAVISHNRKSNYEESTNLAKEGFIASITACKYPLNELNIETQELLLTKEEALQLIKDLVICIEEGDK